nr:hypothetical protein [uncultured Oscillibacter sp.]
MNGVGTFFAVVLFGVLGLFLGSLLDAAEAGAVVFAVAIAAACIVDAIHSRKD